MKNFFPFLLISSSFFLGFSSCKKSCETPAVPILNLKILYYSDSTNYIFGTNKKYDFASLKFYSLKGIDTSKINTYIVNNFEMSIANDSIIKMALNETINNTIYIKYPSNQIDSFVVSYSIYKNDCGGANVDRVWYRGNEIYTGTYNYFTIYK